MSLIHSHKTGKHEIIAITDGGTEFGTELFPGTSEEHIQSLLDKAGASAIETNFNAFLVKSPGRNLLVDAGPRDLFGPGCGKLPEGLKEAGVTADDISHVMLTHLHPDHIAGTVTADGKPVFKNASVFLSEDEYKFWNRDQPFGDETMDNWLEVAKVVMNAYADRIETFSTNADLGMGVSAMALPGHTPGHTGFRVDDGSESFAMVCDIFHAPALQIADPEIAIVFDIDADTARKTRKRVLDMVATDDLVFSGGHMTSPKMARLARDGKGFRIAS